MTETGFLNSHTPDVADRLSGPQRDNQTARTQSLVTGDRRFVYKTSSPSSREPKPHLPELGKIKSAMKSNFAQIQARG